MRRSPLPTTHRAVSTSPVWLFDLDNTLHDANPYVFPHINRSMTAYLAEHLHLTEAEASALRVTYWRRYGATLLGLMRHHGTRPRHFLWHTHQFPDLARMIVFEGALRGMLRRLPGRKVVFSNAPRHYADAVLQVMGVRPLIDRVFAIEQARYHPKPSVRGFHHLLKDLGVAPARCIMVEDSAENLLTAKRLGMRTVWISNAKRCPSYVDIRLESALQLPRAIKNFN